MSGPSGTESDETRSHRGLGATTGETGVSGAPLEAVAAAAVIEMHTPSGYEGNVECWCGERFPKWYDHAEHVAAAVLAALDLREETKLLDNGMGSVMTNSKTGVTTGAFRPQTRVRRWVSSWTSGSEG